MAIRPVFITLNIPPYFDVCQVEFKWNAGLSKAQKQKNITAMHNEFNRRFSDKPVLEISSKSMQDGGVELSAFNMCKFIPDLKKSVPVECIYQSGKVFEQGGPFTDLLTVSPKDAKRDARLKNNGKLVKFNFNDIDFPTTPHFLFYAYLYINALLENEKLAEKVIQYEAFTDIEFSNNSSINCQAMAAAIFVSLNRLGKLDMVKNAESFFELFNKNNVIQNVRINQKEKSAETQKKPEVVSKITIKLGNTIKHTKWGVGKVTDIETDTATIHFCGGEEKKLAINWLENHCELIDY